MSRKYTKIDQYEKQILSMREEGKTHREIAESLGLEKEQIKKMAPALQDMSVSRRRPVYSSFLIGTRS